MQFTGDDGALFHQQQALVLQQGRSLQHLGQQHGESSSSASRRWVVAYHVEPTVLLVIHLQVEAHHGVQIPGHPLRPVM